MTSKILFLLLLLCSFFHYTTIAQANGGVTVQIVKTNADKEGITLPQFEGGETALYQYLTDNIKYPLLLIDIEMEGDTQVKANIGKDGSVNDIEILRGFDPLADDRIIYALKAMPKWKPATKQGIAIEMPVVLNVSFTLNDELRNFVKEQKKDGVSLEQLDEAENRQREQALISSEDTTPTPTVETDTTANRPPEFPGGKEALDTYFKKNLKYPKKALEKKLEGRVIFNITVSAKGEITDIIFRNGFHYECNEEAYYLIKKMPDWIPGLKDGKPTSMQIILAIPFELPEQAQ